MTSRVNIWVALGLAACAALLAGTPAWAGPKAAVYEIADPWTGQTGLAAMLGRAGFDVVELDRDRSPAELGVDLIALGSFISEDPGYAGYVERHARSFERFVERGGVLVQFTQADQTEAEPAFLPEGFKAVRGDLDPSSLVALKPDHPLVSALLVGAEGPRLRLAGHHRSGTWETFQEQERFRVLMASDESGRYPALLEGAHGRGRIILTSMYFDKLLDGKGKMVAPEAYGVAASRFGAALSGYVASVKSGAAPRVVASPPVRDPDPLPFVEGSWTLVVIPDTQVYSMRYPEHFAAQTRWIAEHRDERDIRYVLHVGDIVNNNNEPQWEHARAAMRELDGVVPYALVPGNHDYGPGGNAATRETLLNDYFPVSRYKGWPSFGGVMEPGKLDNSYHRFEAGGQSWLVLALEWGPRDETVQWANRVVTDHPDHRVILLTHAYMYSDETRYDWSKYGPEQKWNPHAYGTAEQPGGVNDGQELWDKLVSRHPNFTFTFNGHVLNDGVARLTSEGVHGNAVHQVLVNYQTWPEGGQGYLRLVEFLPDGRTVQVRDYSPVLDKYQTEPQRQFVLEVEPAAEAASR